MTNRNHIVYKLKINKNKSNYIDSRKLHQSVISVTPYNNFVQYLLKLLFEKFKNISTNPKLSWKLINDVTNIKCRSNDEIIKLKYNKIEINSRKYPINVSNISLIYFFYKYC